MKKRILILVPLFMLIIAIVGLFIVYKETRSSETINTGLPLPKEEATNKTLMQPVEPQTSKGEPIPIVKKEEPLKIIAVGDILLGRGVGQRLENQNKTFTYPLEKVDDILKKGDVVFGNLEESITDSTHSLLDIDQPGGKWVLKNKVAAFEGIKFGGFNLLNLANNHILDYYDKGLNDTLDILDSNGIAHAGAGKNMEEARKPAILEKKGLKIGMLSYTDMADVVYKGDPNLMFLASKDKAGVVPRQYEIIKEDVSKLRPNVDILIVSFHWGKEESFDVLPEQIQLSHKLLDEGVDIILGHHPHQFHGIEIYKGKPIVYSMGNFILDQNDPENQESFILDMEYLNKKLTGFTATPIRTIEKTQVVPQSGLLAADMLKRELELSQALGTKCSIVNDKIIFEIE